VASRRLQQQDGWGIRIIRGSRDFEELVRGAQLTHKAVKENYPSQAGMGKGSQGVAAGGPLKPVVPLKNSSPEISFGFR
jgi:hypothetical protein